MLPFLFAVFQSWESEHRSRLGRERELTASNKRIDDLTRDLSTEDRRATDRCGKEMDSVRREAAVKDAISQTLQKQNRDQQSTINGCLSQAMKLLTPEPPKTTILPIDVADNRDPALKSTRFILLTNKTITPVRVVISCDAYIERVSLLPIGSAVLGGGGTRFSDRIFQSMIQSPAWTPSQPILATVEHHKEDSPKCSFGLP